MTRVLVRSWAAPAAVLLCVFACQRPAAGAEAGEREDLVAQVDASLDAAAACLVRAQSPDGAWRSHVYGPLKDGPSLTPQVMLSLHPLAKGHDERLASVRRGAAYLSTLIDPEGRAGAALRFPSYTAATASRVVALDAPDVDAGHRERSGWIARVREMQLTGSLGWSESDPQFGGWGYSPGSPRKPAPGEPRNPLATSNISATVFCLDALRSAGISTDDAAWAAALAFVCRCQNFPADRKASDPAFDDGGFYFMPGDAAWNKAGVAGTDWAGVTRFHSYGAATADGLRSLLDCGLAKDHPRVIAARRWLLTHFDAKSVPGAYAADREVLRNATYYYYASSVAQAFIGAGVRSDSAEDWAGPLARELLRRQQRDGSWVNEYTDAKEDDPLVATPAAVTALSYCRLAIAGADTNDPSESAGRGLPK